MIELVNINKYYNPGLITETCVFDNFSLKIKDKQFVSVVGSNGSGKTTMLNIICGSIPIDSGKIIIDGQDITKKKEFTRMKNIGRVYQNPALGTSPHLNIIENLAIAENKNKSFNLSKLYSKSDEERYKELLKGLNLGLEDRCDIPMKSLSGGQKQAVALLMATMTDIDFLILDEHTAALDPKTADIIMELTDRIIKQKNLTSIMVTHNLRYAVEYGNRLIMMHEGKTVIDKEDSEKENIKVDEVLKKFTEISIECGN